VAELKGYMFVHTFRDEGISCAKVRNERKGFDELIKGALKKSL
tara:strand:- start:35 stop:163 length:129 start_codon:yes stop_codon:yes gene_type:complete